MDEAGRYLDITGGAVFTAIFSARLKRSKGLLRRVELDWFTGTAMFQTDKERLRIPFSAILEIEVRESIFSHRNVSHTDSNRHQSCESYQMSIEISREMKANFI